MIIGVTGTLASGKDTVSDLLEKKGYKHISLSQILRDELTKMGESLDTANLTKFGNQIRHERGEGYLAKEALKDASSRTIISSIRQPGEVKVLKGDPRFVLIAVDADAKTRWLRLEKRHREGDPVSYSAMMAIEHKQMKKFGSKDMQLDVVMGMADYQINNSGTLEELHNQVDDIIAKIEKGDQSEKRQEAELG